MSAPRTWTPSCSESEQSDSSDTSRTYSRFVGQVEERTRECEQDWDQINHAQNNAAPDPENCAWVTAASALKPSSADSVAAEGAKKDARIKLLMSSYDQLRTRNDHLVAIWDGNRVVNGLREDIQTLCIEVNNWKARYETKRAQMASVMQDFTHETALRQRYQADYAKLQTYVAHVRRSVQFYSSPVEHLLVEASAASGARTGSRPRNQSAASPGERKGHDASGQ